ncbi:hypothetical protein ACWEKT_26735 [Nocardia takedensis]
MAVAIKAGKDLSVIRGLFEHSVTRQTEAIERAHGEGRDNDPQQPRANHATLLERLDMICKLERSNARDMLTGAGMPPPPRIVETMGTHMEQGREDQRAKVVAQLGAIGQEVQRVDWANEIARHNERAQALGQTYIQRWNVSPAIRRCSTEQ